MKNTLKYSLYILLVLFFASCEKAAIGPAEVNDPENNFELLWNDFDAHYGLFFARDIDWSDIYDTYRPQVNAQTSDDELWEICTQMLEELDDGHTGIGNPDKEESFESGSALNDLAEKEFSLDLVENKYLESPMTQVFADYNGFGYSKIKDEDIGYIYLGSMDEREAEEAVIIDSIIDELKQHEAIILDIRNNGGGYDSFAARIAGAFADGEHLIYTVETRNGPKHDDFGEKKSYYTSKEGDEQYTKPVIILTDRAVASAAEVFLLHMNAFEHVVQMGDNTAGDFSDLGMLRFLPNGWVYQYSIQMFLTPDGKSLDGIGCTPEIYVKNTIADMENGNDNVMEMAIEYLSN